MNRRDFFRLSAGAAAMAAGVKLLPPVASVANYAEIVGLVKTPMGFAWATICKKPIDNVGGWKVFPTFEDNLIPGNVEKLKINYVVDGLPGETHDFLNPNTFNNKNAYCNLSGIPVHRKG
jgi:hypothetical protein